MELKKYISLFMLISVCHGLEWNQVGDSCETPHDNPDGIDYYILLWTDPARETIKLPLDAYFDHMSLYENETCMYKNCLFTLNRHIMNVKDFHAILYSGVDMSNKTHLPRKTQHQTHVFQTLESASNFPLRNKKFDDFFKLTVSYKLDSDLPYPYLCVYDNKGNEIGPRQEMFWKTTNKELNRQLKDKIYGKRKLVALFEDNCETTSHRHIFVKQLNKILREMRFNQTVDIYGKCGDLSCPRNSSDKCNEMLSQKYMFYLSFERSFAEDYVTDKLLIPLMYNTVPVVYGGANYNRFLPPGSYLNACLLGPKYLAIVMVYLYHDRRLYESYFKWRHLYRYDYCKGNKRRSYVLTSEICDALNKRKYVKSHHNFRRWWNEDSGQKCRLSSSSSTTLLY